MDEGEDEEYSSVRSSSSSSSLYRSFRRPGAGGNLEPTRGSDPVDTPVTSRNALPECSAAFTKVRQNKSWIGKVGNKNVSDGNTPVCISSLVKLSSGSPSSCRYKHSGLLHWRLRRKKLQYLVVPNEALEKVVSQFMCRMSKQETVSAAGAHRSSAPSSRNPSTAMMHCSASSLRANVM